MFTPDQIAALSAPLNKAVVATRSQAGRELSYIEGWHAIAEANRIFGFGEWDRETVELRQLGEPRMVGDKARVGYSCRVRITVRAGDRIIIREGCGFGSGIDKDVDQAHESALKEAETDAMKRALMTFGNPFGLALYDKTQANVEAAPKPPPPAAPKEAPKPTLTERANRLTATLEAAKTQDDLRRTFDRASGLCADLDAADPERLVELTALYKRLFLALDGIPAGAVAA
jgi:DNA repair and recombination protein RAD52